MTGSVHGFTGRCVRGVAALALVGCAFVILDNRGSTPLQAGTLVTVEPLPAMDDVCLMPAAEQRAAMRAAYMGQGGVPKTVDPIRRIRDPYPSFAAVAVDADRNEVIFTDESLFKVLVYDRLENTPVGIEASRPKREIVGEKTNIEFQSGVYVDKNGEIVAVNNDTRDTTVTFAAGANGDAAPVRSIKTPHGTFGIAVAEIQNEILLTLQHDAAVITYPKGTKDLPAALRSLQGDKTRLADPHGIAYDPKDDVFFVANFGSKHETDHNRTPHAGVSGGNISGPVPPNWPLGREWAIPGSGKVYPPSVTVYRRTATGNEAPIRVIEGPATQFDWPTGVAFDANRRELFVANDMGPSVLVFDANASGNVAPKRVIKGARTGLMNPTGLAVDTKNGELWVTNFGGHSATVYDLAAAGDVAPKRTIRNAPAGAPSLMIGNPGAISYDTKRESILVPN
jgi:DNA-binding beta-propeller fold protein YncE